MGNTLKLDKEYIDVKDIYERHSKAKRRAYEELQAIGLSDPPQPLTEDGKQLRPLMPQRLSSLPPHEVTDLLSQFAAFLEFLGARAIDDLNELTIVEKTLKYIAAEIHDRTSGSPTAKSDAVLRDPRYRKYDAMHTQCLVKSRKSARQYEDADRSYRTASRGITYHGQEIGRSWREDQVTGKRRGEYGLAEPRRRK